MAAAASQDPTVDAKVALRYFWLTSAKVVGAGSDGGSASRSSNQVFPCALLIPASMIPDHFSLGGRSPKEGVAEGTVGAGIVLAGDGSPLIEAPRLCSDPGLAISDLPGAASVVLSTSGCLKACDALCSSPFSPPSSAGRFDEADRPGKDPGLRSANGAGSKDTALGRSWAEGACASRVTLWPRSVVTLLVDPIRGSCDFSDADASRFAPPSSAPPPLGEADGPRGAEDPRRSNSAMLQLDAPKDPISLRASMLPMGLPCTVSVKHGESRPVAAAGLVLLLSGNIWWVRASIVVDDLRAWAVSLLVLIGLFSRVLYLFAATFISSMLAAAVPEACPIP